MKIQNLVRVKLISKIPKIYWLKQFPNSKPIMNGCIFSFDIDDKEYDWVVVYDDLPKVNKERFSHRVEKLTCPAKNTLLVTTEPPSIKSYGKSFVNQFGHVLTSHEKWALPHSNRIFSQTALIWFYGFAYDANVKNYDFISSNLPVNKTKMISTVCSSKQQKHTLHNLRYSFTNKLKKLLPSLDIYGHGVTAINDKSQALDEYKYHIAIENYIGENHWTEKLSDSFLGATLPFYCGATNVEEYFPKESFIYIDIYDVEKSAKIIKDAIENNEYEKRLPAILKARELVLKEYNFFAVISKIVKENSNSENKNLTGYIKSRRALMRSSIKNYILHGYEKIRLFCIRKRANLKKENR